MNQPKQALSLYQQAYEQLYKKIPADLRTLGDGWVILNGARMQEAELGYLTRQLQLEYDRQLVRRRGVVDKLIGWLTR